jgi:hypothetical protein
VNATLPVWLAEFPPADTDPTRFIARCSRCKQAHAIDIFQPWASAFYACSYNGPDWLRCECGRALTTWKQVQGKASARKCSARCTNATGPDCECECVGRNHGSDHMS